MTAAPHADWPGSLGGPALSPPGQSCWVDLGGPVHYLDYGGPPRSPGIVAVHGLGGGPPHPGGPPPPPPGPAPPPAPAPPPPAASPLPGRRRPPAGGRPPTR